MAYALQSVLSNDYLNKSAEVLQAVNGSVVFRSPTYVKFGENLLQDQSTLDYRLGGGAILLQKNSFIPSGSPNPVQAPFGTLAEFTQSYLGTVYLTNYPRLPTNGNTIITTTVTLGSSSTGEEQICPAWITPTCTITDTPEGTPTLVINAYYNPPTLVPPPEGQTGYTLPPPPQTIIVSFIIHRTL